MFLKLFPRYAGRARRGATVAGDHLRGTAVVVENAPKSLSRHDGASVIRALVVDHILLLAGFLFCGSQPASRHQISRLPVEASGKGAAVRSVCTWGTPIAALLAVRCLHPRWLARSVAESPKTVVLLLHLTDRLLH